jgi:hypothetical protein
VQNAIIDKSNPTSRLQTYNEAEFDWGNGRSKIITVHLRYVQLKDKEPPVLPPTKAQVVEATKDLAEAEVAEAIITVTEENNEIDIESVKQAANNAINETMGPISERTKDLIAKNNKLIAVLDSLNHSNTESNDDNSPIKANIPPPIPNKTPVATPIATPTATPFYKKRCVRSSRNQVV